MSGAHNVPAGAVRCTAVTVSCRRRAIPVFTFAVPRRRGVVLAVAGALILAAAGYLSLAHPARAGIAGDVFVSPTGSDTAPGTASAPTSLTHAQQLVRGLNQSMTADVTVVLADGFYRLSAPLQFGSADSGTGGHNVVWTADTGARPVLAGARSEEHTSERPTPDQPVCR